MLMVRENYLNETRKNILMKWEKSVNEIGKITLMKMGKIY